MEKRFEDAEAALQEFLATQGTRQQRALGRAAPALLARMRKQCAVQSAIAAFAEDAAVSALASVNASVAAHASPARAQAVRHWFWNSKPLLYPICEALCVVLKGGRTPPEAVARRILDELAALPADKTGLIWQFGACTIYAHRSDTLEKIVAVLAQPRRRRRARYDADGVDIKDIERLAQMPDAQPAPRQGGAVLPRGTAGAS